MTVEQQPLPLDGLPSVELAHLDRVGAHPHLQFTAAYLVACQRAECGQPIELCEAEHALRRDPAHLAWLESSVAELEEKWPACPELEDLRWAADTLCTSLAELGQIAAALRSDPVNDPVPGPVNGPEFGRHQEVPDA